MCHWNDCTFIATLTLQAGRYTLMVLYVNEAGIMDVSTVSCAASPKSSLSSTVHLPLSNDLRNAHGGPPSKCFNPTPRNPSAQNPTKYPGESHEMFILFLWMSINICFYCGLRQSLKEHFVKFLTMLLRTF